MNKTLEIPKELSIKEGLLYKSLMNALEGNLERKWKLSRTQDLLGKKVTDAMSGEIKVSFEKVARLDKAFRADSVVVEKEEELSVDEKKKVVVVEKEEPRVTKGMLLKKSSDLDLEIRVAKEKQEKIEWMLKEFFTTK